MGADICGNATPSQKLMNKYRDKLPAYIAIEKIK